MMWTDEFFDEVHISDTVFYQNNVGQIKALQVGYVILEADNLW